MQKREEKAKRYILECVKLEMPLRFQFGDVKHRDEVRFIKYTGVEI